MRERSSSTTACQAERAGVQARLIEPTLARWPGPPYSRRVSPPRQSRVRVATCHDPAEAALVRSMLSAHGVDVMIAGEHHAGMLGMLGGAVISMDVWVASADAEEAVGLIRELREGAAEPLADDEAPAEDASYEGEGADGDDGSALVVHSAQDTLETIERRRGIGIALLLACCVTFGTAHMYTRAWLRGLALAALELASFAQLADNPPLGATMFFSAIAFDATGAIVRVRRGNRAAVPVARARLRR